MAQLENIEAIEKRLWSSADNLRANSNFSSNEYFLPVMGLIFLRHAYSRYLNIKPEIEAGLPSRGGKTRALTKEDFSGRGAIYLREEARTRACRRPYFDDDGRRRDTLDRAGVAVRRHRDVRACGRHTQAIRGEEEEAEATPAASTDAVAAQHQEK